MTVGTPKAILVSTFGSAGDLFPLISVIHALRDDGHDVRCAVPRSLALYLRTMDVPTYALGDGAEMRVLSDDHIVTTRFDGWSSWRRTMVDYIVPTLDDDVDRMGKVIAEWRPDVMVTASFAVAARTAAFLHDVPRVETSIYPKHLAPRTARARLAAVARRRLAEIAGLPPADARVGHLLWGGGAVRSALMHDPALLDDRGTERATDPVGGDITGFPYWDGGPARAADLEAVDGWLAGCSRPVVLVTMGSFLGARQGLAWAQAARAIDAAGATGLFVGPHRGRGTVIDGSARHLTVGFVPLSLVAPRVDAVVHHGGIGTTFASLRAARPAVVLPQAFDQPHNARLLERHGVGIGASAATLHGAVERVLGDPAIAGSAQTMARRLVPADEATRRIADVILRGGEGGQAGARSVSGLQR